jgi:hypothetical protein
MKSDRHWGHWTGGAGGIGGPPLGPMGEPPGEPPMPPPLGLMGEPPMPPPLGLVGALPVSKKVTGPLRTADPAGQALWQLSDVRLLVAEKVGERVFPLLAAQGHGAIFDALDIPLLEVEAVGLIRMCEFQTFDVVD